MIKTGDSYERHLTKTPDKHTLCVDSMYYFINHKIRDINSRRVRLQNLFSNT